MDKSKLKICDIDKAFFANEEIIGTTNEEVQKIADPIMNNAITGLNENNYQKYIRDIDEICLKEMSEIQFKATKEKLNIRCGNIKKIEYLGFLKQKNRTLVLYKAQYSKLEDEGIMRMVLEKTGKDIKIKTLWFE